MRKAGRTTRTLGRLPSPTRSNSSTVLLNVGVILDPAERRSRRAAVSKEQREAGLHSRKEVNGPIDSTESRRSYLLVK
ncbi:hypothetical protein EYF80_049174 [Liparis tanakae]|uniref:Uncharacterized protein n=1 Tax=Liparis tanakae TaxID=230148 RepID=A0A4Z2FHL6_9TELE|nr:hypothetical protein EYF80_049174 [Liparis tanakae]